SFFEKLRHSENAASHVEGKEEPAKQQHDPCMQFIVRHGCARLGARASETDHVLASDVRSEDGCADYEPSYISSCKKIIFCCLCVLQDYPPRHAKQQGKVSCKYDPV